MRTKAQVKIMLNEIRHFKGETRQDLKLLNIKGFATIDPLTIYDISIKTLNFVLGYKDERHTYICSICNHIYLSKKGKCPLCGNTTPINEVNNSPSGHQPHQIRG